MSGRPGVRRRLPRPKQRRRARPAPHRMTTRGACGTTALSCRSTGHVSGDNRTHGPKNFSGVVRTSNRVLQKMYNQWQSELEASDQAHAEENRVATLRAAQLQCEKTQQSATLASALEAKKTLKSAKARLEAILEMEKQSNKLAFSEAEKRHKMALDAAEKQHEIEKVAIFKELKEKRDKEQRDAVSMAKQAARQKIRGIENDYLGFKVKVDTSIKAWRKKVGKLRYDLKVKEAELQRERAKKDTQTAYLMLHFFVAPFLLRPCLGTALIKTKSGLGFRVQGLF